MNLVLSREMSKGFQMCSPERESQFKILTQSKIMGNYYNSLFLDFFIYELRMESMPFKV